MINRKEKLKLAVSKTWDLPQPCPVSLIRKYFPEAEIVMVNQDDPARAFCFGQVYWEGEYLGSGFIFDYNAA